MPMNPSTRVPIRRDTLVRSIYAHAAIRPGTMFQGQLHFADHARTFCSRAARRAEGVELEAIETRRVNVHYGVIRSSVEQEHRGLAVQLQDKAVDGMEWNAVSLPFTGNRKSCDRQHGK